MPTNPAIITTLSTDDFLALMRTATRDVVREELSSKRRQSTTANNFSPDDEVLGRKEAAQMLNVSLTTLTTWVKDGILPDHKKGRRRYFLKSEIHECIRKAS